MKRTSAARRRFPDLLLVVPGLLALIWGAVAIFGRPVGDFGVETDFYGDFAFYARQWMSGEPSLMNGFRGPLYYLVLGAVGLPLGDLFLAAKVISVGSAALAVFLLGRTAGRLWGGRVATAVVLFLAGNAVLIEYAYRAGSDLFFLFLFTAVLTLVLQDGPWQGRRWLAAGLVAGAAWLTRYNGAALVVAAIPAAFLLEPKPRAALRLAGLFLAGWVFAIVPWAVYVALQTGDPFWNKNYENVAIAAYTSSPGRAQQGSFMTAIGFRSLGEVVLVDPARFAGAMARNLGTHFVSDAKDLAGIPWAIAAAAGFLDALRARLDRRSLAFWLFGAATFLSLLPAFYNPRFMIPLLPFWAAAAGGLAGSWRLPGLRRPGRAGGVLRRVGPGILLGALAAGALYSSVQGVRRSQDPTRHGGIPVEFPMLRDAVRRAGEPVGPDTPIASRKPHAGYYLNAPTVPIPEGTVRELRESGAHYFLISGLEVSVYPSLHALWARQAPAQPPPGLRYVASAVKPTPLGDRVATLYAVVDPLPYARRKPNPLPPRDEPLDGLSRLDDLRLRLARWQVAWNEGDGARTLDRMDAAARARPDVRLVRGDAALDEGRLAEAKTVYRDLLSGEPENPALLLRLAGVSALLEETEAWQQYIRAFVATRPDARRDDPAWWLGLLGPLLAGRDHAACLAPTLLAASLAPQDPLALKRFGYVLLELRRRPAAAEYLKRALALAPDDREAQSLLDLAEKGP